MKKELYTDRRHLNFEGEAVKAFSFLEELGFYRAEVSSTIVRYEKPCLIVSVYHGRQSYEIGFEISHQGTRYALSELIRMEDPEFGGVYKNSIAATPEAVSKGLQQIRDLVNRYAMRTLKGESATFIALDQQKKGWAVKVAVESQVASIKPRAEKAFRDGQYEQAFELYAQIRAALSPAEKRKADLARRKASRNSQN